MGSGTFYPAASGDDGYFGAGGFYSGDNAIYMGAPGGTPTHAFYRFANVTIPAGAVITSAYVKLTCIWNETGTTCNLNCYFNAADDAVAPTDTDEGQALSLTDAVAWSDVGSWADGTQYDTPSLVDILQDIIDRPGWASGQAVMIVIKDNSSTANADREASAYDYASASEKAELHVEWSAGVNVQATCVSLILTAHDATVEAPTNVQAACASLILTAHDATVFAGVMVNATAASLILTAHAADIQADTNVLASTAALILTANQALISYDIEVAAAMQVFTLATYDATIWDGAAWAKWITAHHREITRLYYLTLTGDADGLSDLIVPMASFQTRRRDGDPTFMAAVIPGISYYDAIVARSSGELVIDMAYQLNGAIAYQEELVRVEYENIRYYQGGRNQSLIVEGHKTESFTPKGIDLKGVTYKAIDNGLTRFRCAAPEMFVNPGDTAKYGGDEIIVAEMVMSVSPDLASMELAEEAA